MQEQGSAGGTEEAVRGTNELRFELQSRLCSPGCAIRAM